MKKSIRKAIVLALALMMVMTTMAQADTIISPVFRLPGAETRPTEAPAVEPTAEPTAEPTDVPAEESTVEPAADPEEEKEITLNVISNLAGKTTVVEGTVMILTLVVEGDEDCEYTVRWQETKDGVSWVDIPGASGMQYTLELKPEHSGMYWRACLDITDQESVQ